MGLPRFAGRAFSSRRLNSRLSSSSTCGPTAINPCGPTAFRGLSKTNYPYVLGQPPATEAFSLPAARRPARHKMGMRHRTAQLRTGLADGCPAADHRVTGLVRAQCCLRSWGLLGFRPPGTAARPWRRRIGVRHTLGPHHVDHFGKLVGDGHDRRTLAALRPARATQPGVELPQSEAVLAFGALHAVHGLDEGPTQHVVAGRAAMPRPFAARRVVADRRQVRRSWPGAGTSENARFRRFPPGSRGPGSDRCPESSSTAARCRPLPGSRPSIARLRRSTTSANRAIARHPCRACREPSGKAKSSKKRRPALPNRSLKSCRMPWRCRTAWARFFTAVRNADSAMR